MGTLSAKEMDDTGKVLVSESSVKASTDVQRCIHSEYCLSHYYMPDIVLKTRV